MNKKQKSQDFEIAYNLERQINRFGITENANLTERERDKNYQPRTLIDHSLELIDPTPNIHTLFVQFNERFFWNVLLPVEVKWSKRMTSCAGTCSFHPRSRECVIALSAPLLNLRPRKDLVETLLHEMIHGYLFLTNNNRDRDGHGPEFCKHMNRINQEAGTKITIYHSFHAEVRLHQQHWWKCNGPCQHRPPYFGMVRRAMNRAPGPSDFWWAEHQRSCGGKYIKIKEPENFKSRNSNNQNKVGSVSKSSTTKKDISNWLAKPTSSVPTKFQVPSNSMISKPKIGDSSTAFKKLGNSTNNVHGWGIGGPSGSTNSGNSQKPNGVVTSIPKFSSSGTLGGINTGTSNLLSKFNSMTNTNYPKSKTFKSPGKTIDSWINHNKVESSVLQSKGMSSTDLKMVECPVCSDFVCSTSINEHIDRCLANGQYFDDKPLIESPREKKVESTALPQKRKSSEVTPSRKQPKLDFTTQLKGQTCPICNKQVLGDINIHIDECLDTTDFESSTPVESSSPKNSTPTSDSVICISDSSDTELSPLKKSTGTPLVLKTANKGNKCLVCNKFISPDMTLDDHLEDCIGDVFNDDSILSLISEDGEEGRSKDKPSGTDKYPCPLCMELVSQSAMNEHLDACLLCD